MESEIGESAEIEDLIINKIPKNKVDEGKYKIKF